MSTQEKRTSDEEELKDAKRLKLSEGNLNHEDKRAFDNFVVKEILAENSQNKLAFVLGQFDGTEPEESAIVTLEKTPFGEKAVAQILSEQSETNLTLKNDIYSTFELFPSKAMSAMKASLIYPATEKHIKKYRTQELFFLHETAEDYKIITKPYLESESFSIQWVYNILEKKTEADRIVFEDPDPETGFILLPDMKWDRKQMEDLYLVGIVQKHGIRSLRELTPDHLPLLKNILKKGLASIAEQFSVPSTKLRVYLHYQPSYYHLHVHFTHIRFAAPGSGVERAHLLSDVIENIELDGGYYQKKSLCFTARAGDTLYAKFKESGRV